MIRSMTGFGRAAVGPVEASIASVNQRGAQVQVRGDLRDVGLEDEVRRRIRDRIGRGSASVQIIVAQHAAPLDRTRLAATWRELRDLATELGAPVPALDQVARLLPAARAAGDDGLAADVLAACDAALAAHDQSRLREGAALAAAFAGMAQRLRALLPALHAAAAARMPRARQALAERIAAAFAEARLAAPDAAALVRETALIAERIDVAEELTRLASHCDALDACLAAGGEVGRRLEFIAQELGRELSTTAAKANDPALTALTVDGRLIVDQLKEQAANAL